MALWHRTVLLPIARVSCSYGLGVNFRHTLNTNLCRRSLYRSRSCYPDTRWSSMFVRRGWSRCRKKQWPTCCELSYSYSTFGVHNPATSDSKLLQQTVETISCNRNDDWLTDITAGVFYQFFQCMQRRLAEFCIRPSAIRVWPLVWRDKECKFYIRMILEGRPK